MTRKLSLLLASALVALTLPAVAEDDPNLLLIDARQGEMHIRAMSLAPLIAMAKGKLPYSAEEAQKLANNLKTLMDLDMNKAWTSGTSKAEYPDATHALPELWTTWPKIGEAGEKYGNAVLALAKVAGDGLEALQSKIGDVGQACKGCHDDFKEEE